MYLLSSNHALDFKNLTPYFQGLPWRCKWSKNLSADVGDTRDSVFHPSVGKIPWRRKWQPALVFLAGESHDQRNLAVTVHRVTESVRTEVT